MNTYQNVAELEHNAEKYKRNHDLGSLTANTLCNRLTVSNPSRHELNLALDKLGNDIPGLTTASIVERVATKNPDNIWIINRLSDNLSDGSEPNGIVAFLMLNEKGLEALVKGKLDTSDPADDYLTGQHEKPAAIYVWALHAKKTLTPALALIMEKLKSPVYGRVDLFAKAVTEEGARFLRSLGFVKGIWWHDSFLSYIHHYRRRKREDRSVYHLQKNPLLFDSYYDCGDERTDNNRKMGITVVHNVEEWMKVMSIRASVYMGEQLCPYEEEYDGNDFAATHLLGYIGDEPAGCLRIRCFADFAKLERLAVRSQFRRTRLAFQLVRAGIELCRTKGYRKLYGHSQERLVGFWSRFGFRPVKDAPTFVFSDFKYVEMMLEINEHPNAVSIGVDPFVIIRPEGRWDRPGILENSSSRPVTNPSVAS